MTIAITPLGPDDWQRWRDMRLDALAEAPFAFCSSLSDWQSVTEQGWRDRLASLPLNLIAELDGDGAGMVSGEATDQEVELLSMWVAPFARGQGVGDTLVAAVVDWSIAQHKSRVVLRVLKGNERARELYERHGFVRGDHTQFASNDGSESQLLMARVLRKRSPLLSNGTQPDQAGASNS